jgi:hypothetical protein
LELVADPGDDRPKGVGLRRGLRPRRAGTHAVVAGTS